MISFQDLSNLGDCEWLIKFKYLYHFDSIRKRILFLFFYCLITDCTTQCINWIQKQGLPQMMGCVAPLLLTKLSHRISLCLDIYVHMAFIIKLALCWYIVVWTAFVTCYGCFLRWWNALLQHNISNGHMVFHQQDEPSFIYHLFCWAFMFTVFHYCK